MYYSCVTTGHGRGGGGEQSSESIDSLYKPLPRTAVLDVSCVDGFALAAPAINRPGDNEVRGNVGVVRGSDNDSNTHNGDDDDYDDDDDGLRKGAGKNSANCKQDNVFPIICLADLLPALSQCTTTMNDDDDDDDYVYRPGVPNPKLIKLSQ